MNGPSETKDVMILSAKNLIENDLSEFSDEDYKEQAESKVRYHLPTGSIGKGMKIDKGFIKRMQSLSNPDLLHKLQVHMAEVQAGNTGLKAPISSLVQEAKGRGILKPKQEKSILKNYC